MPESLLGTVIIAQTATVALAAGVRTISVDVTWLGAGETVILSPPA